MEVTLKVVLICPAGTRTVGGTVATAVLLLARPSVRPPVGAGPLMVTVAVEAVPPITLVGFSATAVGVGASTVRLVIIPAPLANTLMSAVTSVAVGVVLIWNVALVWPASTMTEAGTEATGLPLEIVTVMPLAGAGPLRVTT